MLWRSERVERSVVQCSAAQRAEERSGVWGDDVWVIMWVFGVRGPELVSY